LLVSIAELEEAITNVNETSRALSSAGLRVPSVAPMQFASALRNAADKILAESHHG
jgi:hypothetical protein